MMRAILLSVLATAAFAGMASDVDAVMTKLKAGLIDTLVYSEKDFTVHIKDLIDTPGNDESLVAAYKTLDKDQVNLKHTLLIVMVCKQKQNLFNDDTRKKSKDVLVKALADEHFWIRTEAVQGLRYFGDTALVPHVVRLTEDKSEYVRVEARKTMEELFELYQDIHNNKF